MNKKLILFLTVAGITNVITPSGPAERHNAMSGVSKRQSIAQLLQKRSQEHLKDVVKTQSALERSKIKGAKQQATFLQDHRLQKLQPLHAKIVNAAAGGPALSNINDLLFELGVLEALFEIKIKGEYPEIYDNLDIY